MTDRKDRLKALDPFAEIAKEKGFHINVCLAVTAIVFNSEQWEETIAEITDLAKRSKDCDEFARAVSNKYFD